MQRGSFLSEQDSQRAHDIDAYWQGSTDEKLKALFLRVMTMEQKLDVLIAWRGYVMGAAGVIAIAVSWFFNWLIGKR